MPSRTDDRQSAEDRAELMRAWRERQRRREEYLTEERESYGADEED